MQRVLQPLKNESGMVLVVAILIISALILLGSTAVMESTTDLRIVGNYKTHAMALYAAEAGIEEARARLKGNFTPSGSKIVDNSPNSWDWAANMTSLQSAMTYTVNIRHKTNAFNQILYWSDVNGNRMADPGEISTTASLGGIARMAIYLVTSIGSSANGSKNLEAALSKLPPVTVPGALYVNAQTSIIGNAKVNGNDQCGGTSVPGVVTTKSEHIWTGSPPKWEDSVDVSNNGQVLGTGGTPSVANNHPTMDVQSMIDSLKDSASSQYNVASATHTGMNWGVPVPNVTAPVNEKPSTCAVQNIVYYNTSNGVNFTDIKLAGGSSGCGILIVEGDLDVVGDFSWYGVIIVSGSVKYSGGGTKNITGAVIAGGSVVGDVIGGSTNIVYCSSAVNDQMGASSPYKILSWTEK